MDVGCSGFGIFGKSDNYQVPYGFPLLAGSFLNVCRCNSETNSVTIVTDGEVDGALARDRLLRSFLSLAMAKARLDSFRNGQSRAAEKESTLSNKTCLCASIRT